MSAFALIVVVLISLASNGNGHIIHEESNSQAQNAGNVSEVEILNFMIFSKIKYRFAKTMTFCEMRNNNPSEATEAQFELLLPEGAFVSNFTMEINGKGYKSIIKDKVEANNIHDAEKQLGRNSGIVNHNFENYTFKVSISLAANASVLFFLEYEEEIPRIVNKDHGHFQYTVNILPEIMSSVKHFCVDVTIKEFQPFFVRPANLCNDKGQCHTLEEQEALLLNRKEDNTARIIWGPNHKGIKDLSDKRILGKFQIEYEFIDKSDVNVVLTRNGYFIHRFGPKNLSKLPLHIIFVLDKSGSMCGQRMRQLKTAMSQILDDMQSRDYFNIIAFSSESKNWIAPTSLGNHSGAAYPANFYMKEIAKAYISHLECEGSTNINAALMDALELAKISNREFETGKKELSEDVPTPMIFFLSDGEPTSGQIDRLEILKRVQSSNEINVPIFSLAFGATADFSLLQALSAQNHGLSKIIYDNADADLQLEDFYEFVSTPVLKDLGFKNTSSLLNISDVTDQDVWLTENKEMVVAGRIAKPEEWRHLRISHGVESITETFTLEENTLTFKAKICPCGKCPRKETDYRPTNDTDEKDNNGLKRQIVKSGILCEGNTNEDLYLERFWVYKTLKTLIRQAIKSGNESIIEDIKELSKLYNLVTPYTSLLIITPFNKHTSKNSVTHDAPPVSELTRNKTIHTGHHQPKLTRFRPRVHERISASVYYSASTTMNVKNNTYQLSATLNALIDDKDKAIELRDIKWLKNKPHLSFMNGNGIVNYEVLSTQARNNSTMKMSCRQTDTNEYGKCSHLIDCIRKEFIYDIKIFVNSYFCPLRENGELFVGVCCTKQK